MVMITKDDHILNDHLNYQLDDHLNHNLNYQYYLDLILS